MQQRSAAALTGTLAWLAFLVTTSTCQSLNLRTAGEGRQRLLGSSDSGYTICDAVQINDTDFCSSDLLVPQGGPVHATVSLKPPGATVRSETLRLILRPECDNLLTTSTRNTAKLGPGNWSASYASLV